jgi:phosphoglycolate phosphatase-like HAD superfamily hydrolase
MILRAAARLGVDPGRSWVIGDRIEDVDAGAPLGCPGILVLTGYGRAQARETPAAGWRNVRFVAWDLPAAVAAILGDRAAAGGEG